MPLTLARTTAWFSLAEAFLSQIRIGAVALVPGMWLQPVHPAAAAAFVVDAVESGPPCGSPPSPRRQVRQLAGPERHDAAAMARAAARTRHPGVRVVRLPLPMAGWREGLLPDPEVTTDLRTFDDCLAEA